MSFLSPSLDETDGFYIRYDMYSGDSRAVGTANTDLTSPSTQADDAVPESGPALEVIEYANGETIWLVTLFYERRMSGDL